MAVLRQAIPPHGPWEFMPDWGHEGRRLWDVIAAAQAGELEATLDAAIAGDEERGGGRDSLRVLFSLSLLRDVLRAGGSVWVRDSRLIVSWPDWSGIEGRRLAQAALVSAREARPLTQKELERVAPLFAPDLDGDQLARVLEEGSFSLRSVSDTNPAGVPYQEAFASALRYWTMPYRGRSGRMRRFVLTAQHSVLGPWPVVAGILELGDEAPFCTWRDDMLGLSPRTFVDWLSAEQLAAKAKQAADRLRGLRRCLRATSTGWDLARPEAEHILAQRQAIEAASHGRSLVSVEQHEVLKDRKRLAYGLRLARGELALAKIAAGHPIDPRDPDLTAGIRGLHDLVLPRLHMEATVCGAIPPFAQALGGKLMVAFFAHPDVVSATTGAEGELLGWSFDLERLAPQLPDYGMLCLTTKGLYANHAAIYNRAEAPGAEHPLRLMHLANTEGTTTTLLSTRTVRLAEKIIEDVDTGSVGVSKVYGSGGAKRHRAIERATIQVGLPARLAMAGIRRPVYGMPFASNRAAVAWLGENPQWLTRHGETREAYAQRAVDLWHRRWLTRAVDRIRDYALVPSMIRILQSGTTEVY